MHHLYILYIDPGIGSLVAQVLIAGLATFIVFFKNGFKRILFRKKDTDKKSTE